MPINIVYVCMYVCMYITECRRVFFESSMGFCNGFQAIHQKLGPAVCYFLCVCIYVCICVCIYIYIYIYIYILIDCMYIYADGYIHTRMHTVFALISKVVSLNYRGF